jgi:site-specific DNA-methyltransferase (adenine-specific)
MNYKVLHGDCIESLKTLDDESVNCCVTSPPYWGLRDYGESDQLGLEETPEEYVANMVKVFSEVKRVLTKDGTLWLNLGDSYAGNCSRTSSGRAGMGKEREGIYSRLGDGLKSKDLVGIPWRVAFALQADGWYLRQDIIWHKPNPMPESVTDRCTKSHEYIFLLSKSSKYYYDHEAVKEKCSEANIEDFKRRKTLNNKGKGKGTYDEARPDLCRGRDAYMPDDFMRNKRSVWTVNTKPYPEAHFATYPKKLIRPCIKAGCPKGGVVLDPFGGSGTTAEVANELQRDAILCELNPKYCELIEKRLSLTQFDMFPCS